MTLPTILVASGTANTGSKVVRQLSESGKANIRALVRNPGSDGAKALAGLPNVAVVKGDFSDAASLKDALKNVNRAFLVSSAGEHEQYDREVAFIAAATEANVEAVVRISTANVLISLEATGVYARAHARIEQYIEQHKSRVIDIQPNWYLSNLTWQAGEAKATGKITYPVTPEQVTSCKFAGVDTRDVAGAAVAILLSSKEQLDKLLEARTVEVHGPAEATFADHVAAISKVTGKPLEFQYLEPNAWAQMLESFGQSKLMSESFRDTILTVVGVKAPARPPSSKTSDALLAVYTPKYTVEDWARDNAAAFA